MQNETTTPTAGPVCDQVLVSLRKIIQSIDLHSRFLAKKFGLTGPQLIILGQIARGGEITAGEVAKTISLSQATVTGILERLERHGLIARQRSDTDRRRVLLHATPTGVALLREAPPLMQESFVNAFNRLPDWEQSMILTGLQRLVSLIDVRQLRTTSILSSRVPEEDSPSVDPADSDQA